MQLHNVHLTYFLFKFIAKSFLKKRLLSFIVKHEGVSSVFAQCSSHTLYIYLG